MEKCFDLKGSMINREVHEEEITPGSTLKDKNLLKLTNEETLLLF